MSVSVGKYLYRPRAKYSEGILDTISPKAAFDMLGGGVLQVRPSFRE